MSFGTPERSGGAVYSGRLNALMTSQNGFDGNLRVDFILAFDQAAGIYETGLEDILDANLQDFIDYMNQYPGFTLPTGTGYTGIGSPSASGGKSYEMVEDVTPTP